MRLLGSTDTILPYAESYARIILLAAPVMCASFVLSNVLRAEGEATLSMYGMCVGGLLNVGLDPLFIFVFEMGIAGAALATALSQLVSFLILGWQFLHGRSIVRLRLQAVSRSPRDYGQILLIGFPTICRQGFASLSSALLNNAAAAYSDAAVAAVTISNKVYLLVRSIDHRHRAGLPARGGLQLRRGRASRARGRRSGSPRCSGRWYASLARPSSAPVPGADHALLPRRCRRSRASARQALLYACAVMPMMAYSTYVNQLYQCLGFHQAATLLASCRNGLLYVPLILLLPGLLGLSGVAMSQPAADFLTFLVSIPFQIWFFRHKLRG